MLKFFKRDLCNQGLIKVILEGGFGNQLFQFAASTQLAVKEDLPLSLEFKKGSRSYALDLLGLRQGTNYRVSIDSGSLKFEALPQIDECPLTEYRENGFTYSEIEIEGRHVELIGYFQSFKYFQEISEVLRKFILNRIPSLQDHRDTIYVHARLGDMALNPTSRAYHGIVSDEYIKNAIASFEKNDQKVVVITEELALLKKELPWIASRADEIQGKSLEEDFQTLLSAKNLVISNSTFSWWAAWLSQAKTVAPLQWFTPNVLLTHPTHDLLPETWMTI
jgi:hypothetical protein